MSRKVLITFLFVCLGVTLAVPFVLAPKKTKLVEGGRHLVLASPHWEGIQKEFERAFRDYHKQNYGEDVQLEWVDLGGGTSTILRVLQARYKASPEGVGIDVMFGGGTDPYVELARDGLLEPFVLPGKVLSRIPPEFAAVRVYDPEHRWYGAVLSGFGIVYNKVVLKKLGLEEPRQWKDLTDPGYFSWVASPDPRQSGSGHMAYEIICQAHGWEEGFGIIVLMGANMRGFGKSGSQAPKACAAGDVACGLAIDFYAWAQIEEVGADKIGFVVPEGKSVINPDSIGILKGARNMETAERFVSFVMSDEAQKLWMLPKGAPGGPVDFQLNRLSIIPELYEILGDQTCVRMNPFKAGNLLLYSSEKASERWGVLNDFLGASVVDTHAELAEAWKKLIARGLPEKEVAELVRPSITEEEMMQLAGKWGDKELRGRKINEWLSFYRDRYKKMAAR